MILKKNDIVTVRITDIGESGEGIGKVTDNEGSFVLFVKDGVVGDELLVRILKLKKSYGYAKIEQIVQPSKDRVEADCAVSNRCGGCQLRQMSYEAGLRFKEQKVYDCLKRIGGLELSEQAVECHAIHGMKEPYHYRNKAQFPVQKDRLGGIVTGFYATHTHTVIPCDSCLIQAPVNEVICATVKEHMEANHISAYDEESGKGLVRHILTRVGATTGEVMVCLVLNGDTIPRAEALAKTLSERILAYGKEQRSDNLHLTSFCLNINKANTNVILGSKIIKVYGEPYITDYIGKVAYQISPLSFYQVNPVQTEYLYETVLSYAGLTGNEVVWDLYCGIGTISLFLAARAKHVYAVEIVPEAIDDARQNAKKNHIENAEFFVGAAEDILPAAYEKNPDEMRADVIVIDPPRKGCEESLLKTLLDMQPSKIVYVSCDPATLARDLRYLTAGGYEVKAVQPVDMFPGTVHVETVVVMERE